MFSHSVTILTITNKQTRFNSTVCTMHIASCSKNQNTRHIKNTTPSLQITEWNIIQLVMLRMNNRGGDIKNTDRFVTRRCRNDCRRSLTSRIFCFLSYRRRSTSSSESESSLHSTEFRLRDNKTTNQLPDTMSVTGNDNMSHM